MGKYVNPFTDIGFKIIWGSEANKDVLIQLLNALLEGEHYIEDLIFLNKEERSENVHDRGIVYDIYCKTSTGEHIIVEMQNQWHSNFLDRTLYYVCRSIGRQRKMRFNKRTPKEQQTPFGESYNLKTVYGIFLMNFREEGLESKFRTDTAVTDRDTGTVINTHFRQIYLQFPYFTKELDECKTIYDKLMYTIKNMDKWNRMPEALKEQVFQRLAQLAEVANLSEADRIAYDKAVDSYCIYATVMNDHYQKGISEGVQKGREEGREEGLNEGKRQMAATMKRDGMDFQTIAKYSGLSIEEIEAL